MDAVDFSFGCSYFHILRESFFVKLFYCSTCKTIGIKEHSSRQIVTNLWSWVQNLTATMRCPVFTTFLLLLVRLIYDPWHMDGEWWEDCKYTSFICPLELPADRSNPGNMLSLLSLFPCTRLLWFLNLPFCQLVPYFCLIVFYFLEHPVPYSVPYLPMSYSSIAMWMPTCHLLQ